MILWQWMKILKEINQFGGNQTKFIVLDPQRAVAILAFSLRDEIGTCFNIKVDLQVTDKSPFFKRPFPVREEDIPMIGKEMQCLVDLGILKQGMSL